MLDFVIYTFDVVEHSMQWNNSTELFFTDTFILDAFNCNK